MTASRANRETNRREVGARPLHNSSIPNAASSGNETPVSSNALTGYLNGSKRSNTWSVRSTPGRCRPKAVTRPSAAVATTTTSCGHQLRLLSLTHFRPPRFNRSQIRSGSTTVQSPLLRVLIVRLSALGDIIHTWPLADSIRSSRSDVHITWVVEGALRPLLDGHPSVDEIIEVNTRRWRRHPLSKRTRAEVAVVWGRLRRSRPDIALDPQGLLKSAIVTWLSGASKRVGLARSWRREAMAGFAYTETVAGPPAPAHVVQTNLALLKALDIDVPDRLAAPDGRWLLADPTRRGEAGRRAGEYAVILPGAGGPSKILPVMTLAELAAGIVAHGLAVVVAWGPGEEPRAREVAAAAGRGVEVAPPTDLRQLACLLARSCLVIGADTGPVHLAASLGVPTVGCYLATDWRRNGPLGARVTVVSGAATSASPTNRARARGVREIAADELLGAALGLLS